MASFSKERVGVLGVGHFGAALVSGLIHSGFRREEIMLSPRGSEVDSVVGTFGVGVAADNAELVRSAEIVLLSVRPLQACEAIANLPWRPDHLLISVCAGIPLKNLETAGGQMGEIVRAMPMTSASINASPTAMFPNSERAAGLLKRLGSLILLKDEGQFELATVIALAYALGQFLIARTEEWAVQKGMDRETARMLTASYFESGARVIAADKDTPGERLISALATKGGVTEAALGCLRGHKFEEAWREAFDAGLDRVLSLGAKS